MAKSSIESRRKLRQLQAAQDRHREGIEKSRVMLKKIAAELKAVRGKK